MKIIIVGLGLIGASYAKGLMNSGHQVYGVDINQDTIKYAKENGFVLDADTNPINYLQDADMMILSLYPEDIVPYIEKYQAYYHKDLLITDVCGVKEMICAKARVAASPASFIGSHPMAGREKVGIEFATPDIFKGACLLVTPLDSDNLEGIEKIETIARDLGFKKYYMITPKHHDKMIAYTSELTHAIAVSLVNSETSVDVSPFIGDSYRDLTRIAMINEKLWSELFFANKDNLLEEMDSFINELNKIKKALKEDDYDKLKEMFISSKEKRSDM